MKPTLLFLFVLTQAYFCSCLNIVEDFRVNSMSIGTTKKVVNQLAEVELKVSTTSSSFVISTTTSVPKSSPTVELSREVLIVYTDSSNSFYYFNALIQDIETGYESEFPLLLDTGSSMSWIYNESCVENGCDSATVNKFNDSKTLSFTNTFELSYSGDSVSGELIELSSNQLDLSINNLTLDDYILGLTNDSPSTFDNLNISGIIGVSSSISDNNWIYQLYNRSIIDQAKFSLFLINFDQSIEYIDSSGSISEIPPNYGGLIFLGSESSNTLSDKLYYTNVIANDNSYWLINLTSIEVFNGQETNDLNNSISSREAIIDTGTTGIVLPLEDADNLLEQLFGSDLIADGEGNYAFPCNLTDRNVILSIGGNNFNLTSQDFMGSEYTTSSLQGYCASKIQGMGSTYWVLGATFLERFYTVFDLEGAQVGIGEYNFNALLLKAESNSSKFSNSSISTDSVSGTSTIHTQTSTRSTASSTGRSRSSSSSQNNGINMSHFNSPSSMSSMLFLLVCYLA